jgi:primosomal protein N' (replication factor Y) (superfamily II helicase)
MSQGVQAPVGRVVGVLPDVTGVDKIFSYLVPCSLAEQVAVGSIVRVPLGHRRVRGWVIEEQESPDEVALREIHSFVSLAATDELVALARFGAWRYSGRLRAFLVAASPDHNVRELRRSSAGDTVAEEIKSPEIGSVIGDAVARSLREGSDVLRLPPGIPRLDIARAAIAGLRAGEAGGSVVVLVPERADVERLVGLLRGGGADVATYPEEWERARLGADVVVGTRSAVFAPVERLSGLLVLDAHDEAYTNERTPTWQATVLGRERARISGARCLLVSATPSLDLTGDVPAHHVAHEVERAGWPRLEILDRRGDDPRSGLFAPALSDIVRGARREEPGRPVVAVLNRTGRARLLACGSCGSLVVCERCGAALRENVRQADGQGADGPGASDSSLICPRCDLVRPRICLECHSTRLKSLRVGVSRVAEEFAALIGEPASEVTSATVDLARTGLFVGTEAVLHRVRAASLVIWLDFDQELGANRLRGAEQALALLGRSGRLVGPRSAGIAGYPRRVVVQTRLPDHLVLQAAAAGDPELFSAAEIETRRRLRLPPFSALALLSGEEADEVASSFRSDGRLEVGESRAGGYLVRAPDDEVLADELAAAQASSRQLRVEVDPIHV